MRTDLNLANQPFHNRRPIWRLTIALWILAATLIAVNALLFYGYRTDSLEAREALSALKQELDSEAERISALESRIDSEEVASQNIHVDFLNRRITERVFPWSQLFDELGAVLPQNVRLLSLQPQPLDEGSRSRGRRRRLEAQAAKRSVEITIAGIAKTTDDMLQLIENLFEHSAFVAPVLDNESLGETNEIRFNVKTRYLPDLNDRPTSEPTPAEGEPSVVADDDAAATSETDEGDDGDAAP